MALIVFSIIVALTIMVGVPIESMADPTNTLYIPRPEWYFMWLFQALKLFPGNLEPLAIVGIPVVGVVLLLLIPFIDRNPERHPRRRPVAVAVGVIVVLGWVGLTYAGITSQPVTQPGEASPEVALGKRVYRELNCSYCHSISGQGGAIGPDLSAVGGGLDKNALFTYLQDPHAMIPKSLHPKLKFTSEVHSKALSNYLLTLGARVSYSAESPKLFDKDCSACHTTDGSGDRIGPDLSRVGSYRSQKWIAAFTEDPKSVTPDATMPAFRDALSAAQIDDLAAYLSNFRGVTPTPTPAGTPAPTVVPATPTHTPGIMASPTPTAPQAIASPTPKPGVVSFSADVQPIFQRQCIACHGANGLGDLNMTSHQTLMTTGKHSPVVIPGDAERSSLYQSLKGKASGIPAMPPGTPLTDEQIDTIARWINQGAPQN